MCFIMRNHEKPPIFSTNTRQTEPKIIALHYQTVPFVCTAQLPRQAHVVVENCACPVVPEQAKRYKKRCKIPMIKTAEKAFTKDLFNRHTNKDLCSILNESDFCQI